MLVSCSGCRHVHRLASFCYFNYQCLCSVRVVRRGSFGLSKKNV